MERTMKLVISAAEQKRREVFDDLARRGYIPGPIPHKRLYAHSVESPFPFGELDRDKPAPLRSNQTFVNLRQPPRRSTSPER